MNRGWRLRYLIREGVSNFWTGGLRIVLLVVVGAAALTGAAVLEAQNVDGLIARGESLDAAGRFVLEVTSSAESDDPILARNCDAVRHQGGVVASGAIVSSSLTEIGSHPGTRLRFIEMTPAAYGVLVPDGEAPGNVVGAEASEELGVSSGAYLAIGPDRTLIKIDRVMNSVVRLPEASRGIVVPNADQHVADGCYVEVEPAFLDQYRRGGLNGLARFSDGGVVVRPLVVVAPEDSPERRYEDRATRHGGAAAAAIIVSLVVVLVLSRRSEIGLYRATGAGRSDVFIIYSTEFVYSLAVAAAVAGSVVAAVVVTDSLSPEAIQHAFWSLGFAAFMSFAGTSLLLPFLLGGRNVIDSLKDT